jgi:hypothetical protein
MKRFDNQESRAVDPLVEGLVAAGMQGGKSVSRVSPVFIVALLSDHPAIRRRWHTGKQKVITPLPIDCEILASVAFLDESGLFKEPD